jgi:uncharacterized protein (DUF1778 family)
MIEKRTFLTVKVTESQRAALKKAAHRDETNMSELVRRAVSNTLRQIEPECADRWETTAA